MSSPHKQIILTSSPDGLITAYDISLVNPLTCFSGSRSPRRGLITIGKSFIAASHVSLASGSGSIHLYNWYSPTPSHNLPVPEPVAPLASTLDGLYVFAGGISGAIHVLRVPSGDIIRSVCFHVKAVSCLGISEDGSVLISGGDDGKIVTMPIFQLVDEPEDDGEDDENEIGFSLNQFCAHDGSVTDVACSGSKIISCSVDCTCKIWNFLNGVLLQRLEFSCEILGISVATDPTRTLLYFAGSDGSIYKGSLKFCGKRDTASENYLNLTCLKCKHNSPVISIAMTNDGRKLVAAAEDGNLLICESETGEIKTIFGDNGIRSSISDMVLVSTGASRYICSRGSGEASMDKGDDSAGVTNHEFCKVLNWKIEHTLHLEDALTMAKKDESKAIDMLESAIAMYEKLLELLLKEAQRGSCVAEVTRDDDETEQE